MSFALQVKKFMNSEHTGEYVTIKWPVAPAQHRVKSEAVAESETAQAEPAQAEPVYENIKIHYMEEGTGEPLILIHSIGQSIYTWRSIFYRLSDYYRVIAIDLPGFGYSDRPRQFNYTVSDQTEAISLFMDALGIKSAHFIGFSMGAGYVLDFIRKYKQRVGRVIICSPGGVTPEMPTIIRMMNSSLFGMLACRLYGISIVEKLLQECFFDLTNINPELVQEYYRPISDPNARRAIRYSLLGFDENEIISNLRDINANVLMIYGAEDKWHPSHIGELYHAALRNAQLAIVRNAGHMMHEEKPDRLVDAVLEYIPVVVAD